MSKIYSILYNVNDLPKKMKKIFLISKMILKNEITYYPDIVKNFEKEFSKYHNVNYGITFCNGTNALESVIFALDLQKDDEVIVPSCTFHASIDPIKNFGAKPVFVDIEKDSVLMSISDLEQKITSKTKAIIVVHTFGYVNDMNKILQIAKKYDLKVIEDCSHAHGAEFNGQKVGSFGNIGCFSLQGAKAVAAGEGGISITNDKNLFLKMSIYGHFNKDKDFFSDKYKVFYETGYGHKARANPLGIALASVDFKKLDKINANIIENIKYLKNVFQNIDKLKLLKEVDNSKNGGFFGGFPLIIKTDIDKIINIFKKNGINISKYPFALHHKLQIYGYDETNKLVNTEELSKNLILIDRRVLVYQPAFIRKKINNIVEEIKGLK